MKYVFPARFTPELDGGFSVFFPDLDGCYTTGDDLNDAMYMASDVLAFTLCDYKTHQRPIPSPSSIDTITKEPEEFIRFVECEVK